MSDAYKKLVDGAKREAAINHAEESLKGLDRELAVLAEYRFKIYTAHVNAGFSPEDALFLCTYTGE